MAALNRNPVIWNLEADYPGWRFRDLGDGRVEARDGDVRIIGTPASVRRQLSEQRTTMSGIGQRTNTEILMSIKASVPDTTVVREGGRWVARGPWSAEPVSARCLPDLADRVDAAARGWRERPANLGVL